MDYKKMIEKIENSEKIKMEIEFDKFLKDHFDNDFPKFWEWWKNYWR